MSNCCHDRGRQMLDQARRAAEELLTRRDLEPAQEEPMRRYVHTIPYCCPSWSCGAAAPVELDGVLEALARQNQLLLDILGAVNALNAAVLSIQSRL